MKFVTIEAGDKEYKMSLDTRAIIEIEGKLGSFIKYADSLSHGDFVLKDIITIILAAMKSFNKNAKEQTVYELCDALTTEEKGVYTVVMEILQELLASAGYKSEVVVKGGAEQKN